MIFLDKRQREAFEEIMRGLFGDSTAPSSELKPDALKRAEELLQKELDAYYEALARFAEAVRPLSFSFTIAPVCRELSEAGKALEALLHGRWDTSKFDDQDREAFIQLQSLRLLFLRLVLETHHGGDA